MTGASRLAVFSHGVVPSVLPSLLGIVLYRLENIRSSLVSSVRAGSVRASYGDEPLPIPHGFDDVGRDIRDRAGRGAYVGVAACANGLGLDSSYWPTSVPWAAGGVLPATGAVARRDVRI